MDEQVKIVEEQSQGTVTFANEVISTIVGIAACDIEGVAGMCGGFKDGIVDLLGKKNLSKGVKITLNDNTVVADLAIVVDYGVR
ncbi:MAG: Asp23/Gls24 family envelope stress response protein, partial [Christensenellaceae bacterium]|nr:Asp23/Gls24 family envelope stress response protein [Christensenellaceae bacterium]